MADANSGGEKRGTKPLVFWEPNCDPVVLSIESATKVLIEAGFEYEWVKGDSRFRLGIPNEESAEVEECSTTPEEKIRTIVTYLLTVDPTPSWRRIISSLDQLGNDATLATKLYQYAEPITDPTLTPENIAAVLEQVEDWKAICNDLKVPIFMTALPKIMLAKLIIDRYDIANWMEISSRLFSYGQERAVQAAKKYLPVSFQERALEKTLTLENMCHSLKKEKWYRIAGGIHISKAKRDEIFHQFNGDSDECSKATWEYWLKNHPSPSWERIAEGLFQIWEHEDLKELEKNYPTVISPAKRKIACQRAIQEKDGVYVDRMAHGVCCGFPRAGKSSFKERLVGQYRLVIDSTGCAEKVMRIEVVTTRTVLVEEQEEKQQWREIGSYDEEVTLVADKVTMNISKIKPKIGKGSTGVAAVQSDVKPTPKSNGASPFSIDPLQLIESSSTDKPYEGLTIVAASQGITSPRNYDKRWTHYMSDVGGQLEFQELYPNLLSGPSLYYYTFKANQKFDEKYDVEYVVSGKSTVPYLASTTTRESILQFLASIASIQRMNRTKVGSASKPRVLFIATHIDMLAPTDDLHEIDGELQQIVKGTQAWKDGMIVSNTESQLLFPVNNLSEDDEKIQRVREVVHEVVTKSNQYRFEMPYTWAIFSFTIQNHPEKVIHYSTCIDIGRRCGIDTEDDLKTCLWYLHHLTGILRYYDVPGLRHLIFKDMQYFFDLITKLVTATFTFKNATNISIIAEDFKKGKFSFENLKEIHGRKNELISSEELIKLLEHLRILAAYQKEGSDDCGYFLPCSLVHADIKEVPDSSPVPSLHFTFGSGFCPVGVFGALVADLLLSSKEFNYEWRFTEKDPVYRNRVSFMVGPYRFHFTATPSFISVDILDIPRRSNVSLAKIGCHVKKCLTASLVGVTEKLNYDSSKMKLLWAFQCPGVKCRGKTCYVTVHSAIVEIDRSTDTPYMLRCPYSPDDVLDLPHNHNIWFEEDFRLPTERDAAPKYVLNSDYVEATEGESPTIHFTVTSTRPLAEDAQHALAKEDGRPATKRFKVQESSITLSKVRPGDSGIYSISCRTDAGLEGKETFELDVTPANLRSVSAPESSQSTKEMDQAYKTSSNKVKSLNVDFERAWQEIPKKFRDLSASLFEQLQDLDIKVIEIRKYIANLPFSLVKEVGSSVVRAADKLKNKETLAGLYFFLNESMWNFLDYHLLQYLVERFGSGDLKKHMEQYVHDLVKLKSDISVHDLVKCCLNDTPPEECSEVSLKTDTDPKACSVTELDTLRKELPVQFWPSLSNFAKFIVMDHSNSAGEKAIPFSIIVRITDRTFDSCFPKVIFWGPPHQYCITSRGASIHLPDIGIALSIPEQAMSSTDDGVDLLIRPCYTGPFEMPTGYESASPTYLIQPSRKVDIQKDVTLEIHHHASLRSEDDCKEMAFLSASSIQQSSPVYVFKEITQSTGIFHPHIQVGKIAIRHFCFMKIAKRRIQNCYSARLYRSDSGVSALFCMCIYHPLYIKHCDAKITEEYKALSCKGDAKTECHGELVGDEVTLQVRNSVGWKVTFDKTPTKIRKEDLDIPLVFSDLTDYPPKFSIFVRQTHGGDGDDSESPQLVIQGLDLKEYSFEMITPGSSTARSLSLSPSKGSIAAGSTDLCKILTELQGINREWRSLGIALGLEYSELEEIEANYPTSVKNRMAQVIDRWLSMTSGQFSWRTLCDALSSDLVDQTVLAHSIENKYCLVD